ncbi:MAG TPA: MMPL family transporter [Pedococcus sp.]|nr:MMPL family transporter [Pedococcus sp.]
MPDRPDHPDRSASALSHLGAGVARHPKLVVLLWLVAVVAGFATSSGLLGESLFHRLTNGEPVVAGPNQTGRDLLVDNGHSSLSTYTVRVDGVRLDSPEVAKAAREAARGVQAIPGVASVATPYAVPGGLVSPKAKPLLKDGSPASDGFVTVVTLAGDPDRATHQRIEKAVDEAFAPVHAAAPGARMTSGGLQGLIDAITGQLEVDLRTGEGIALPLSFIVMVVVFGGFLAAGMPVIGAIASVSGALASLLAFSYFIDLDASAVNVVTILGLGLCIDYGLLTVSRFREELRARARGIPAAQIPRDMVGEATARTVDAAGRTVVFSGLTVAISLGGLMVFEAQFMKAVGAAGLSVVLIAMLVALTLIPALCVLGARRLLKRGTEMAPEHGVFSRLAQWVHRRPVPIIVVVLVALVGLALPALDLRLTNSGSELLPTSAPQRQFFEDMARDYPLLGGADLVVVTRAGLPETQRYAAALPLDGRAHVIDVERVTDDISVVDLDVEGGALGDQARTLVDEMSAQRTQFATYAVGQASGLKDFTASMLARAPIAFGLVALATLVLLFLMTGSVVIPVKALLLNVVSLGAALGVIVWVFQHGNLQGPLGFDSVGAVESTIPLLVLAFGFGLSMDYEVFLISRIVELHERGYSNDDSVVVGLQRSGRIITCAALLVVIVFSGFVVGKLLVIKEIGVGLAIAVLLDATLVRMLLVPATMTLLGDWNWWAPRSLRRWHARFGITE